MCNTGTTVFRIFWIRCRLDPQMWTGGLARKSFKKPFLKLTCEQVTWSQVQTFNPFRTELYGLVLSLRCQLRVQGRREL